MSDGPRSLLDVGQALSSLMRPCIGAADLVSGALASLRPGHVVLAVSKGTSLTFALGPSSSPPFTTAAEPKVLAHQNSLHCSTCATGSLQRESPASSPFGNLYDVKLRRSCDWSHTLDAHVNHSGHFLTPSFEHLDWNSVLAENSEKEDGMVFGPGYVELPGRSPGPMSWYQHMSFASSVLHVAFTLDVMLLHSLQTPRVVKAGHVQLLPDGHEKSSGMIEVNNPAYAARAMRVSEQLLLPMCH